MPRLAASDDDRAPHDRVADVVLVEFMLEALTGAEVLGLIGATFYVPPSSVRVAVYIKRAREDADEEEPLD